jgi:hypothetical protein
MLVSFVEKHVLLLGVGFAFLQSKWELPAVLPE